MQTKTTPNELMSLVLANSTLRRTQLLICLVLAMNYDEQAGHTAMSTTEIVNATGAGRRTVWETLEAIRESGEWHISQSKGEGRKRNTFTPNLELLAPSATGKNGN